VTTKAPARPAGHVPGPADAPATGAPADAPATGAPAESVPAEEQLTGPPAPPRPETRAPRPDAPAATLTAAAALAATELFARPFGSLQVGDRFATATRTVQEPDILQFADLTGDAHPQHVDPEWAAGSRFGEQIAHGLLVLSFAVGLLPLDPERVVALRRVGDAVFKQPVKIGDTLQVEGEILRTHELDPEHGLVEARIRIVNQHGRLAVRASVELVWRA
jgi:3-hydroxybutyryl-CoA dehydratase